MGMMMYLSGIKIFENKKKNENKRNIELDVEKESLPIRGLFEKSSSSYESICLVYVCANQSII